MPGGPAHLHAQLRELSGHDLSEARDKYHCSVPNKANIVVTGIDLVFANNPW
jgi:hypothetical protein